MVDNDNGGTADATDWTLTAEPATSPSSAPPATAAVTDAAVDGRQLRPVRDRPGRLHRLDLGLHRRAPPPPPPPSPSPSAANATCTITNTANARHVDLEKSSDPASGSTVQPGDRITYTVTATKTGGVDPVDLVVNDDLSARAEQRHPGRRTDRQRWHRRDQWHGARWNIPSLGGPETVTYIVEVNEDAYGVTLRNAVTGDGSDTCPQDASVHNRALHPALHAGQDI